MPKPSFKVRVTIYAENMMYETRKQKLETLHNLIIYPLYLSSVPRLAITDAQEEGWRSLSKSLRLFYFWFPNEQVVMINAYCKHQPNVQRWTTTPSKVRYLRSKQWNFIYSAESISCSIIVTIHMLSHVFMTEGRSPRDFRPKRRKKAHFYV